jgi:hypothetical protein
VNSLRVGTDLNIMKRRTTDRYIEANNVISANALNVLKSLHKVCPWFTYTQNPSGSIHDAILKDLIIWMNDLIFFQLVFLTI